MSMPAVPTIIPLIMKPHEASPYPTSRVAPQYANQQLPLGISPSSARMQAVKPSNILVSPEASNKAKPKKEKSSKGDGLFSKGSSKKKLLVTQKKASSNSEVAACPSIQIRALVQQGGMMNPNPTPSGSNASRLMRSQSHHGNVASNGATVNNILIQQQQQQSSKSAAPPVPIQNQQPMRQKQMSGSLHGHTAANCMALKSILQQQHHQQQSCKGASAPVPIQNQPMRQQQVYQTTQGSPPRQSFNLPQARPVALSSSQVQIQGQEFRNKNNPFGGRSDTSKNSNSGAPDSRMPLEYGRPGSERSLGGAMQYSDLRTPQLLQKQNALRVQMAASTDPPQSGNTRTKSMDQQRHANSEREVCRPQATRMTPIMDGRPMATPMESDTQLNLLAAAMQQHRRSQQGGPAPMQPGVSGRGLGARTASASMQPGVSGRGLGASGRGPGAAVYGRHQSERMVEGQQQMAHATPTIQHLASRGASFRAAKQAQMLLDSSRPPANQPTILTGQLQRQRQGSNTQVFLAHPVVGQYERGSFKQYSGQFASQQKNLRTDFYESHQEQGKNGQHLSNLSLGSGSEGEYAAGYLHGLQQATHNSTSAAGGGANPAIKKENSHKSMASQMFQGLTAKSKSKPKNKGVVEHSNSNNGGATIQYS
jgi:hypothetical protein